MAKIERRIKKAFSNAVPDVLDSVLEKCAEAKGQVTPMTEITDIKPKVRRPLMKIAVFAAAAVILLTVTVTAAVNLSGLQSKDEAALAVLNHAVMSSENEEQKDELAFLILSGMDYDSEAELAFSGGRAVYKMRTTVGGYIINATVDAKTLVILDSKIEYDDELMTKALAEQRGKPKVDSEGNPYPVYPEPVPYPACVQPIYILRDHYGLIYSEIIDPRSAMLDRMCDYADNGKDYVATVLADGYRYELILDGETLEELSYTVTELEDYNGERVLHEKVDGYISMVDAVKIVSEDMGIDLWKEAMDKSRDNPLTNLFVQHMENVTWIAEDNVELVAEVYLDYGNHTYTYYLDGVTGEVLKKDKSVRFDAIVDKCNEYFGARIGKVKAYRFGAGSATTDAVFTLDGATYTVIFDTETCEIISVETGNLLEEEDPGFRNIYTLSTEAPDGMISEAEAAATALEYFESHITQALDGFRLKLEGNVYRIAWEKQTFSNSDYLRIAYTCDVDAKTGAIVKATPALRHADLSSTSGFIGKEKATEFAKQHDENGGKVIEKVTGVELGEMCISASDNEIVYTAVYQVHFDRKGREDEIWFYAVDAVTGEVYGRLGNGLYK